MAAGESELGKKAGETYDEVMLSEAMDFVTDIIPAAGLMTVTTKAIDHIADWRNQLHDMKARQDAESRAMSAHD